MYTLERVFYRSPPLIAGFILLFIQIPEARRVCVLLVCVCVWVSVCVCVPNLEPILSKHLSGLRILLLLVPSASPKDVRGRYSTSVPWSQLSYSSDTSH